MFCVYENVLTASATVALAPAGRTSAPARAAATRSLPNVRIRDYLLDHEGPRPRNEAFAPSRARRTPPLSRRREFPAGDHHRQASRQFGAAPGLTGRAR